jgi:hypothetical protein
VIGYGCFMPLSIMLQSFITPYTEAYTHSPWKHKSTTLSCISINVEILVEL